MALIKCPDCGKDVSSKAKSCLNCGCPISDSFNHNQRNDLPIDIITPKFCYVIMAAAYIVYFTVNEPTCGLICCIVFTAMSVLALLYAIVKESFCDKEDFIAVLVVRIIIVLITIACFIGFASAGFRW